MARRGEWGRVKELGYAAGERNKQKGRHKDRLSLNDREIKKNENQESSCEFRRLKVDENTEIDNLR